jgi:hypothetical protein
VCVQAGTTTELNLSDYFRANKMKLTPISYDKSDESAKSLEAGRCDVLTSDQSQLYAQRIKLAKPERLHRTAGSHLQGTAGAGGSPRRRRLVRHRQVDAVCYGRRRRTGHRPPRTSRR